MSYCSLLVYLDHDAHCSRRTELAIGLARQFSSHIVGIAPTGTVDLPTSVSSASTLETYASEQRDALRISAARATRHFAERCLAAGIESFETIIDDSDKADALTSRAHCADLTIVGQADSRADGYSAAQELVEQQVTASGQATLVVPYASCYDTLGERVLVAWDESREASRAISDSLPLLRLAQQVRLACWAAQGARHDSAMRGRLDAVCRWLTRHGVNAKVELESTDIPITESILSRAAEWSSDLIVMGAYGRSRLSELVLGGASRGMLTSMTVPVLMSH